MAASGASSRRAGHVAALALLLVVSAPAASAAPYANGQYHYRFEYPDGWTLQTRDGVDIIIKGPASGGFQANIVAQNEYEENASEDGLWLQTYVQNSFLELGARINLTVVEAPRTFTTGSGRLAGDYTFDQQVQNTTVRQRQVFFASHHEHRAYFLTFTDKASSFGSHNGEWQKSADTFTVEGAPSGANGLLQPAALAIVAAVAGLAIAGAVVLRRRKGKASKSDAARH